jgi:hypothetical protein
MPRLAINLHKLELTTNILIPTGSSNYKELRNNKLYIPRIDSLAVCE